MKKPVVINGTKGPEVGQVPVWRGQLNGWKPEDMTGGGGGPTDWGDIGGTLSDQTDLQAELDGKEDVGVAAGLVAAHEAAGDPHPVYLTETEADALYDPLGEAAAEVAAHEALPNPHPQYLSSQSNQAASAANGSFAFQTLSFSNTHNVSFGTSAGSAIFASVLPQSAQTLGLYASSNTTGQSSSSTFDARSVTFRGAGILSVGYSAGEIVLSVPAGGGGAAVTASASNGSFTAGLLAFSNANNVTFGTSAGSVITASVAAPGAAAENNWVNLLGANTAGNTTASGSTIGYSGINITLSGTNGSVVNISAPATSSLVGTNGVSISTNGSTISIQNTPLSFFAPMDEAERIAGAVNNGTMYIRPVQFPYVQFDRAVVPIHLSQNAASSGSHTISVWLALYTRNASTLSLLASASRTTAVTLSGTQGSYSWFSGMRNLTVGWTTTLQESNYWLGFIMRTTSGGTNALISHFVRSNLNSNFVGEFGLSHNTTIQQRVGYGLYTATTSSVPNSIAFSQIQGSNSLAFCDPFVNFLNGTV